MNAPKDLRTDPPEDGQYICVEWKYAGDEEWGFAGSASFFLHDGGWRVGDILHSDGEAEVRWLPWPFDPPIESQDPRLADVVTQIGRRMVAQREAKQSRATVTLNLSKAVDLWRQHRGLTETELALAATVFPEDIKHLNANYERDPKRLTRLAKALGVQTSTLISTAAHLTYGRRPDLKPEDLEPLMNGDLGI